MDKKVIFEKSRKHALAHAQIPTMGAENTLPAEFLREDIPILPELSELEVVRHFTRLSQKNYSIDGQFYPLGSCTMKYNPRAVHQLAGVRSIKQVHPLMPENHSQDFLKCLYELQQYLLSITGMQGISLTPMAGAQGEYAGVAMIKKYHLARGDVARIEMLVPDSAHGTNPASAVMCGFQVKEIPTKRDGNLDIEALKKMIGPKTAGIMLTNPSTLGVFEKNILEVAQLMHQAGGLLYYDGANLNAILGIVRPGDMGFDVMHMNMHKTFATPHGGGGPGSGPVAVGQKLLPFLPIPFVKKETNEEKYSWTTEKDLPHTIGRLSCFMGNAAILFRAYLYIRMLGKKGLERIAHYATLNANYLKVNLVKQGIPLAFPERLASHEFLTTFKSIEKKFGVTAMDIAKRLLDYNMHAPTTYFPLGVAECFLIEPTETESKTTLDLFIKNLSKVINEVQNDTELVKTAPHNCPVKRINDVKAAKELKVIWSKE